MRPPKLKRFWRRKYSPAWRNARIDYTAIVVERYRQGLPNLFSCHRCGRAGLDLLGFDGPPKPLLWVCAGYVPASTNPSRLSPAAGEEQTVCR
jgi:hypothetical protein